jgi:hypothetical protein
MKKKFQKQISEIYLHNGMMIKEVSMSDENEFEWVIRDKDGHDATGEFYTSLDVALNIAIGYYDIITSVKY